MSTEGISLKVKMYHLYMMRGFILCVHIVIMMILLLSTLLSVLK